MILREKWHGYLKFKRHKTHKVSLVDSTGNLSLGSKFRFRIPTALKRSWTFACRLSEILRFVNSRTHPLPRDFIILFAIIYTLLYIEKIHYHHIYTTEILSGEIKLSTVYVMTQGIISDLCRATHVIE